MKCGLMWGQKRINNGFGSQLTPQHEKLLEYLLVIVLVNQQNNCGVRVAAASASLPPVYRQCAVCYTDFWEAYEQVLPSKRHCSVGKDSGHTSYIERFNNTLRQRVSRLVRKTLSFSKSIDNHIGAIWYFIHHYNNNLRA